MYIQGNKQHELSQKTTKRKIHSLNSCAKYTNNSKNLDKKNQKINREEIDLT
jgi:hypothetical protein